MHTVYIWGRISPLVRGPCGVSRGAWVGPCVKRARVRFPLQRHRRQHTLRHKAVETALERETVQRNRPNKYNTPYVKQVHARACLKYTGSLPATFSLSLYRYKPRTTQGDTVRLVLHLRLKGKGLGVLGVPLVRGISVPFPQGSSRRQ